MRAIICILFALRLVDDAAAQAPLPESRRIADSLRAFLPDSLRGYADSALNGATSNARMGGYIRILETPEGQRFVFRGLESEPDPRVRSIEVGNLGILASGGRGTISDTARAFLRRLVESDPDSAVVQDAVQVLRLDHASADLALITDRTAHGPAPDWLLREQERARTLADGIMLPAFMSDPPVPFAVPVHAAGRPIRMFAIGDWGFPDTVTRRQPGAAQLAVGAAIRHVHAARPFDLGITLGDNFYGAGLPSPTSPRWRSQYEAIYGVLGVPVYASLGNHDYYSEDSPATEIAYTWHSRTWHMPSRYYTYTVGPAQFFVVDGYDWTWAKPDAPSVPARQLDWLRRELEKSRARWKIVYGHFPAYVTAQPFNGRHFTQDSGMVATLVPILKGRADIYIAGHSHTLQYFKPIDGVQYIVAGGAGAPLYDVDATDPRLLYASATSGFASLQITDSTFTTTFVGVDGRPLFSHTLRKRP